MKRLLALVVGICVLAVGCATLNITTGGLLYKEEAVSRVSNYETAGMSVGATKGPLETLCASGKMGSTDCAKARIAYSGARDLYMQTGVVLSNLINATTEADVANLRASEQQMIIEIASKLTTIYILMGTKQMAVVKDVASGGTALTAADRSALILRINAAKQYVPLWQ